MSALLAELTAANVAVWVEAGQLRYRAAPGVVTAALLERMRQGKAELVAELKRAPQHMTPLADLRREFRGNASALLAELERLPELTGDQEAEAAYYRGVLGTSAPSTREAAA